MPLFPRINVAGLLDLILGRPLPTEEEEEHKAGVWTGIPMLGLDALASSAYGPEAALTVLLPLGVLSLRYIGPLLLVILALLGILFLSYRQTIAAYPSGGGAYIVAKSNLGTDFGLLAAAALILDYILNVAVAISAGVAALVSALPSLHGQILPLCLGILAVVALVNLRGIRDAGVAWSLPTYLFITCLGMVLVIGLVKSVSSGGHPRPVIAPPELPPAVEVASIWLLLHAFASGCTAMTGVEAVSNGITAFARPAVKRAQQTLTAIVLILAALLAGVGYLTRVYGVGAIPQDLPGYQSVLSQIVAAVVGRGTFYYVTLGSILAVLCLSANTSFADFPRLCRLLAEDDFLPHLFANKGRRLVYAHGIVILSVLAGILLGLFGGITDRLIPLFAVGAFLAFTLSQAGMVIHWRRNRARHAPASLFINAVGTVTTGTALLVILIAKFREGAWITVLLIAGMLWLFHAVKRHYEQVQREISWPCPLNTRHLEPPVVVIPIGGWNRITEKALRFALRLSHEIIAVHACTDESQERALRSEWTHFVEEPLRRAGLPQPELITLTSPYRHLFNPLIRCIRRLEAQYSGRQIAVIIPELVEGRWWEYLLHHQRAALLRTLLFFLGDRRLVVINVPWYLSERREDATTDDDPAEGMPLP